MSILEAEIAPSDNPPELTPHTTELVDAPLDMETELAPIEFRFPTLEEIRGADYDSILGLADEEQHSLADETTSIFDLYADRTASEPTPAAPAMEPARITLRQKIAEIAPRPRVLAWGLGGTLGALITASVVVFGVSEISSGNKPEIRTAAASPTTEEDPASSTTTSTTQTTVPETTTTTEAPRPVEFMVENGELIGTLSIPAICIDDIQVFQYDSSESPLIGTGQATLDRAELDADPSTEPCERIEQQPDSYTSRAERTRASATISGNPSGHVANLQPIAGLRSRDGLPVTPYPGAPGNALIAGHGSTFSAAFADLPALQPGDAAFFERSDGRLYIYELAEHEILPPGSHDPYVKYSHPDNPSTMTLYHCSDAEGRTGSDAQRSVTRWVLRAVVDMNA